MSKDVGASIRPRLLDLFCGAGGAAMGYHRAGFDVVGVDIERQPHYPFELIQADVFTMDLGLAIAANFSAIHASPPCQAYTRKPRTWGRTRTSVISHHDLLTPIRERLSISNLPWVIENVPGAPIRGQLLLCGSMFGLRIQKHRYFEGNWSLPLAPAECHHEGLYNPWQGKGRTADQLRAAQDTPWIPMSGGASRKAGYTGDLFNAIPPAFTEFIGRHLLAALPMAA